MTSDFIGVLRQSSFLDALSENQLLELGRHLSTRRFAINELLVRVGDQADGLYIIRKGAVAVLASDAGEASQAILDVLGPGQMFGEISLLDGQPRSATVKATDETECLFLPTAAFSELLKRHPEAGVALLPVLCQRLRQANQWVQHLL